MNDMDLTLPVVSTEWLGAHLDDPRIRIVDIRGLILPPDQPKPHYFPKRKEYLESHIPGAVFIDWTRDIVDLDDPIPVQIAPPGKFASFMSSIGVGDDTLVVAYDDHRSALAARLWWALRYHGHDGVKILDGGWHKWVAEGRPVTAEIPHPPAAPFTPHMRPALRVDAGDVSQAASSHTGLLIDARSIAEYEGHLSRAKRFGHIPGAVSFPTLEVIQGEYEELLTPDQLAAKLKALGITGQEPLIAYCNGGISASLTLIALETAGLHGALYDGSWGEWGNRPDLPIQV